MVWTDHDHVCLGVIKQNPAWQATWTACALLIALFSWRKELAATPGTLMLQEHAQKKNTGSRDPSRNEPGD